MKPKLFLDLDNTTINSIKKIVELYDKDFGKYKNYKPVHWTEINTYEFTLWQIYEIYVHIIKEQKISAVNIFDEIDKSIKS